MRKKKFLLERDIQKACVEFARKNGWWARKFSSPANRSVPDYLFAKATNAYGAPVKIAVEFKAPGKKATDAQIKEAGDMSRAGWEVYVIDDVEKFKAIILGKHIGWLE